MQAALAIARRGLLGGGSCITFSRSIQTGIQRFQTLLENVDSATDKELDSTQSKGFSYFPPVPGEESSLRTHIQVFTAEKVPLKAAKKGVHHVRVVVKGLGPGRLAAIQGLTLGGLEVISITDNTPVPHNGCRPRKARRL
ncbi:putative 28S ribosomal protein [Naja naja]|nr:putative 28S ribosomal protein [Naja naja]